MTTRDYVFLFVSLITVVSALLAVTARQVVHAALWLVVALGTLAGCYVVLGNELVGLVQLLVYVGAVVVLVVFALMLTRSPVDINPGLSTSIWQRAAAAVMGAAMTGLVASLFLPYVADLAPRVPEEPNTHAIATAIFGYWVWPFELVSVLLLVSLIGSFALARVVGAAPEKPVKPGIRLRSSSTDELLMKPPASGAATQTSAQEAAHR